MGNRKSCNKWEISMGHKKSCNKYGKYNKDVLNISTCDMNNEITQGNRGRIRQAKKRI